MDPEYRRDTRKVVKMLSIVVAVFAVLDLPIHIVFIWKDFDNSGLSFFFIRFFIPFFLKSLSLLY